jgi:hypothetical protein
MAQDCEYFELGHIYMAPPDHHLLVKQVCAAGRTMEDRVRILRSLANGRREQNHSKIAATYETQAQELQRHAQQIRKMLLNAGNP